MNLAVGTAGLIGNYLGLKNNGGCFVAGTLVHISDERDPGDDQHDDWGCFSDTSTATVPRVRTCPLPIERVALGARILTRNPVRENYDASLPEVDPRTWLQVSLVVQKTSGALIDIDLLRPAEWIEPRQLQTGSVISLDLPELDVHGVARVTAIQPCPPIATTDGSVVTGRFITRQVDETVALTLSNGETIEGTAVHPIWSFDEEDWRPLGEFSVGDQVLGDDGPLTVVEIAIHRAVVPVYNLEVHGEHVYQIGLAGVLVHNNYVSGGPDRRALTRRAQGANDVTFRTQAEARAEAIRRHGGTEGLFEEIPQYGGNKNLTGPGGEPWYRLRTIGNDGTLIDILHHSNGHRFLDSGEFELPHYHGPFGVGHISYEG